MRDLTRSVVLAKARQLVPVVYDLCEGLPPDERFGLAAQMKRSAVSIAANIAEGLGRGTEGDYERFLRIASGSAAELETLLRVCSDVRLTDCEKAAVISDDVRSVRAQIGSLVARVHRSR